jgi:hypothetical protein
MCFSCQEIFISLYIEYTNNVDYFLQVARKKYTLYKYYKYTKIYVVVMAIVILSGVLDLHIFRDGIPIWHVA